MKIIKMQLFVSGVQLFYTIPKMYFFVHRHIFAIKELWLYVAHSMSKSPAINLKYGIKNL